MPLFSRLLLGAFSLSALVLTTTASSSPRVHQPEEPPIQRRPGKSQLRAAPAHHAPRQFAPDRPLVDHTADGRPLMVKRYANTPHTFAPILDFEMGSLARMKYRANKTGIQPVRPGFRLVRTSERDELTQDQLQVLSKWGQPDWLRGPFRTTRGDQATEWLYDRQNRIFQWVDGQLVYQGPVTDAERTMLVHGAPSQVMITHLEPNIRRETFIYRDTFRTSGREKVFSFSNGKLIFHQETP